jgi:hypothetical protein
MIPMWPWLPSSAAPQPNEASRKLLIANPIHRST